MIPFLSFSGFIHNVQNFFSSGKFSLNLLFNMLVELCDILLLNHFEVLRQSLNVLINQKRLSNLLSWVFKKLNGKKHSFGKACNVPHNLNHRQLASASRSTLLWRTSFKPLSCMEINHFKHKLRASQMNLEKKSPALNCCCFIKNGFCSPFVDTTLAR